jgi:hypothetical protein
MESTLKVAFRPYKSRNSQKPSSPKPKSNPKAQTATAESRNLSVAKIATYFFLKNCKEIKNPPKRKTTQKPTNPKVTNNFIFKVDAHIGEGLKMGYRFI